jgi:hypothetical protein
VPQPTSNKILRLEVSSDTAVSQAESEDVFNILEIESNDNSSSKTLTITSVNVTSHAVQWSIYDRFNTTSEAETVIKFDMKHSYACVGWVSHKQIGIVLELYIITSQ